MSSEAVNINKASQYTSAVLDRQVWKAEFGVGTFIAMHIGNPTEMPQLGLRGEWRIWICDAAWRLESGSSIIVASEDPLEQLQSALHSLEGKTLRKIEFVWPGPDTTFHFQDSLALKIFALRSAEDCAWRLYEPSGYFTKFGPGSTCTQGFGRSPSD